MRSYAQNLRCTSANAVSGVFARVFSPNTPLTAENMTSVPSHRLPYCFSCAHVFHSFDLNSLTSRARRMLPFDSFDAFDLGGIALSVLCLSSRLNNCRTSNVPSPQNLSTVIP